MNAASNPEVCTSMSTYVGPFTATLHSIYGYTFERFVSFEPFRSPSTSSPARSWLNSIRPAVVGAIVQSEVSDLIPEEMLGGCGSVCFDPCDIVSLVVTRWQRLASNVQR